MHVCVYMLVEVRGQRCMSVLGHSPPLFFESQTLKERSTKHPRLKTGLMSSVRLAGQGTLGVLWSLPSTPPNTWVIGVPC